jgi:hypothetical protein
LLFFNDILCKLIYMVKNNGNWAFLCAVIRKNSLLKPWQLEIKCEVGTGDGQLWRAWTRGERVGRDYNQSRVLNTALDWGWLEGLEKRQIAEIVRGASVAEVAGLAKPDQDIPSPLPYPPEKYRWLPPKALAIRSTALLLRDHHNPSTGKAQLRLSNDEWKNAVGVAAKILGQEYKKCLAAITETGKLDGAPSRAVAKATDAKLKKIADRRSFGATKAVLEAAYLRQAEVEE